ncbi:MAG: beta-ketoacyl-[acyl-carrier-protein] synthase family protein [Desulfobacter sp.]
MKKKNRVFITGMGAVTPIGIGVNHFFTNLIQKKTGIGKLSLFDTARFNSKIGGQINRKAIREKLTARDDADKLLTADKTWNYLLAFGAIALEEALGQAGYNTETLAGKRTAIILATSVGGMDLLFDNTSTILYSQKDDHQDRIGKYTAHSLTYDLAERYGIDGYCCTNTSACTSSLASIGAGADLLKMDLADIVITGGVDILTPFEYSCFDAFRSLDPVCCRPFDKERKGLVLSEGAGILVLESNKSACNALCEISGYSLTNDSNHLTAPDVTGTAAATAITQALNQSERPPETVDYICAHGTGTKLNDVAESNAIHKAFKETARNIPVSSVKSSVGHMNGASAALNVITCTSAMADGLLPATLNLNQPDPECGLDLVSEPRSKPIHNALVNAYAFGGQCGSLFLQSI